MSTKGKAEMVCKQKKELKSVKYNDGVLCPHATCESNLVLFKAALINIFTFPMDQMTMCNVRGVTHSEESTV